MTVRVFLMCVSPSLYLLEEPRQVLLLQEAQQGAQDWQLQILVLLGWALIRALTVGFGAQELGRRAFPVRERERE